MKVVKNWSEELVKTVPLLCIEQGGSRCRAVMLSHVHLAPCIWHHASAGASAVAGVHANAMAWPVTIGTPVQVQWCKCDGNARPAVLTVFGLHAPARLSPLYCVVVIVEWPAEYYLEILVYSTAGPFRHACCRINVHLTPTVMDTPKRARMHAVCG